MKRMTSITKRVRGEKGLEISRVDEGEGNNAVREKRIKEIEGEEKRMNQMRKWEEENERKKESLWAVNDQWK